MIKEQVNKKVDEIRERLVEMNRWLYDHPEIGSEEYKAAELLAKELEKHGFTVEREFLDMETAFRAEFKGKEDGPTIAFLTEYDALPQIGHACGHNIIGVSAVGAGIAISKLLDEVPGNVQVLGCPAEEGHGPSASSKCIMARNGAFDDVDFSIMLHPFDNWAIGSPALAMTNLDVVFTGKTSNPGVAPEKGVNALAAALTTFDAIDHMREQLKREAHPIVYGIIKEGGHTPNIIPDRVVCQFGVRSSEDAYVEHLIQLIENCAKGACIATGAEMKLTRKPGGLPTKKHNKALQKLLYDNLKQLEIDVEDPILSLSRVPKASTDFACVSHVIPSLEARVAIGPPGITTHTKEFADASVSEQGNKALIDGTKALAMSAVDLYTSKENRENAVNEFLR